MSVLNACVTNLNLSIAFEFCPMSENIACKIIDCCIGHVSSSGDEFVCTLHHHIQWMPTDSNLACLDMVTYHAIMVQFPFNFNMKTISVITSWLYINGTPRFWRKKILIWSTIASHFCIQIHYKRLLGYTAPLIHHSLQHMSTLNLIISNLSHPSWHFWINSSCFTSL